MAFHSESLILDEGEYYLETLLSEVLNELLFEVVGELPNGLAARVLDIGIVALRGELQQVHESNHGFLLRTLLQIFSQLGYKQNSCVLIPPIGCLDHHRDHLVHVPEENLVVDDSEEHVELLHGVIDYDLAVNHVIFVIKPINWIQPLWFYLFVDFNQVQVKEHQNLLHSLFLSE